MDKFFKISERGSSFSTETIGGLTTFLTMAYIIAVNPSLMVAAGMSFSAALTATCFAAAIMTLIMGLVANRPLALASGMGINAVVAYTLVIGMQLDWRVAMSIVFLEGIVISVLVLCGLRQAVMDAIPVNLRRSIAIGIGLFIAFIGMKDSGIIVTNSSTVVALGTLSQPAVLLGIISILLVVVLHALHVKGDIFWSIIVCTVIGIPMGVTLLPTTWNFGLDFSAFAAPFQSVDGSMALAKVFLEPILLLSVFSIMMSDFFDTMGTVIAVGQEGEFTDKNGDVADIDRILLVDSAAAAVGGFCGASSVTTYVESSSGAAAGARTGFSNIIIAIGFILAAFLTPIISMVSYSATAGALVFVGYLMMTGVGEIDWKSIEHAFPAFIVILAIPLTYSITDGIGLGFISYVIIMAIMGKAKEVKPLMWVASIAFLLMFVLSAV